MRSTLGRFIDGLFVSLLMGLASFVILRSLFAFRLAIILSLLVFVIALRFVIYFQNKRYHELNIKADEKYKIDINNFELRKLKKSNRYDFFKKLLSDKKITPLNEGLVIDDQILLLIYVDQPLSDYHLFSANYIASEISGINEIIIVCNAVTPEAQACISRFSIPFTFFTPIETYALMKKKNYFLTTAKKTQNRHHFRLKNHVFLKKQAKNFFRVGFLLYLACLFVPFVKTYIITASICLALGLFCLIFGRSEVGVKSLGRQLIS